MGDKSLQNITFQPNANQLKFAELFLDFDQKRTLKNIADELEISRQAIWVWFKDVNFVNWLNSQRHEVLQKSLMVRYMTAIKKAIAGDYNFSRLLFEMEKEYIPAISHNISIKITEIVINHVVEVVNKYVDDDTVKRKIGEELAKINLN